MEKRSEVQLRVTISCPEKDESEVLSGDPV